MKNQDLQITPKQLAVLTQIQQFQTSSPYSATIAELAASLSVARTTVFEHIASPREKGLLDGKKHRARSLKLTAKAIQLLDSINAQNPDSVDAPSGIPLLGNVAAGTPIDAIEDKQFLSINSVFGNSDDVFALQVRGDSMIDDGLDTGDYVICKKSTHAHQGQMVVAIVDEDTATVKRFYQENNRVRLEPSNQNYQPIYTNNCRIEAVVIGSIKRF